MTKVIQRLQKAVALHRAGRLAEAEQGYLSILAAQPTQPDSLHNLGTLVWQKGNRTKALKYFKAAVESAPEREQYWRSYIEALSQVGLADVARQVSAQWARQSADMRLEAPSQAEMDETMRLLTGNEFGALEPVALSLTQRYPDHAFGWQVLATLYMRTGRETEAVAPLGKVTELMPENPDALGDLGCALQMQGGYEEAITLFQKALASRPNHSGTLNNLGLAFKACMRNAEAEAAFRQSLAANPNYADAWYNLASLMDDSGRFDEAVEAYRKALSVNPTFTAAHVNLAIVLGNVGRFEEAEMVCRKALKFDPTLVDAVFTLASLKRLHMGDQDLDAIEFAIHQPGLPLLSQIRLHYALGKVYQDIAEDFDLSFKHYADGARLQRAQSDYELEKDLRLMAEIAEIFTSERISGRSHNMHGNALPVFIVGMPRSGTSLTEQMLASHQDVFGAGESIELSRIAKSSGQAQGIAFPAWVSDATSDQLQQVASHYFETVIDKVTGYRVVTDKMPMNFLYLGLIAMALPQAKIIHVRRNPVDTCLSGFTQLFSAGHAYSYDLMELGGYYRGYANLMAHWRKVLPAGMMLEVDYEEMVQQPERIGRQMLEHCGLDWDPACLQFHATERAVRTASFSQVRQPLYQSSIARWKRYEKHLAPLLDALGPLANANPD